MKRSGTGSIIKEGLMEFVHDHAFVEKLPPNWTRKESWKRV